jgi:hypothetical protein
LVGDNSRCALEEPLSKSYERFGFLLVCLVRDAEGPPPSLRSAGRPRRFIGGRRRRKLRSQPVDLGGREIESSASGSQLGRLPVLVQPSSPFAKLGELLVVHRARV